MQSPSSVPLAKERVKSQSQTSSGHQYLQYHALRVCAYRLAMGLCMPRCKRIRNVLLERTAAGGAVLVASGLNRAAWKVWHYS